MDERGAVASTLRAHLDSLPFRLPPASADRLARSAFLRRVRRGEIVLREGEPAEMAGLVLTGALGLVQMLADGRSHVLGLLTPRDMFGRFFDGPLPHAVEALSDAELLCIPREAFERTLRETPEVEEAVVVAMQDELTAAREWILILGGKQVAERVAAFLAIRALRQHPAGHGGATVRLPLARKDLARCLGLRPETLSRSLRAMERRGLIRLPARDVFQVPDMAALIAAAGPELDAAAPAAERRRRG